jgi:hypothetical protein
MNGIIPRGVADMVARSAFWQACRTDWEVVSVDSEVRILTYLQEKPKACLARSVL